MFIRGDEVHGAEIIRFLSIKGRNPYKYLGTDTQAVYFIENGEITCRGIEGFQNKCLTWEDISGRKTSWYNKLRRIQDWAPEDKHITSSAEVAFIESYFQIPAMESDELHNLRDMVVMFFTMLATQSRNQIDFNLEVKDPLTYTTAMQSITSIIDRNYYEA